MRAERNRSYTLFGKLSRAAGYACLAQQCWLATDSSPGRGAHVSMLTFRPRLVGTWGLSTTQSRFGALTASGAIPPELRAVPTVDRGQIATPVGIGERLTCWWPGSAHLGNSDEQTCSGDLAAKRKAQSTSHSRVSSYLSCSLLPPAAPQLLDRSMQERLGAKQVFRKTNTGIYILWYMFI